MLGNKKSKIRFFIFLTGLFLFLNSCGLDTFVVVEPPYSIGVGPNVDTEDYSYKNFQFSTNCKLSNLLEIKSSPTQLKCKGTPCYSAVLPLYRI